MALTIEDITGFRSPYGDKYAFTKTEKGVYFRWSKRNEKLIDSPDFNWSGYLDLPEPITYRATQRDTGKKQSFKFPKVSKFNLEERELEFPVTESTGYLMPRFNFINIAFNIYDYRGEAYRDVLKQFGLKENSTIPAGNIPVISAFRDSLMDQMKRQVEEVQKLDQEIADVLKVYYYETDQATLQGKPEDYTEDEIKQRVADRSTILRDIRRLFQSAITKGASSETLEEHWVSLIRKNKYIPEYLVDATIFGMLHLSEKKDPLIDASVKLAEKINPLESILEDVFLDDRISSTEKYSSKNEKPHQSTVDLRFKKLRKSMKVIEAFYVLKEQLHAEGWEPEEYGLKDEPQHYNRAVNKRITNTRRK